MKRAGSLLRLPAPESNAALAVTASSLHSPRLSGKAGVRRYTGVNNLNRVVIHMHRAKVAEKGEKYGDDTHPQARENMVIFV